MNDNEKYLEEFVKDVPFDEPDDKHRDVLKKQLLNAFPRHRLQQTDHTVGVWRIIMKGRTAKLAAAAAIIVVVLVKLHFVGNPLAPTVTLAQAIRPMLTARTATFKINISGQGVPSQEFDGMFMEPCRMRHTKPGGGTVIVDLEKGTFVTLLPELRQAVVLELTNIPEDPGDLNFFQCIRMRILEAQSLDDEFIEFLGEQEIDGQSAIGYHVRKPDLDCTVWAGSESKMPIRIEVFEEPMTVTMSNIGFDVELDESLFSLEVPAGYTTRTFHKNLSEPTEEDFIESFRIWAQHMDGTFPSKMHRSAVNEFFKYQQEKMKEKGIEPSVDDMIQMQQTVMDMTHGFPFVEALSSESDWQYLGKDVKLGETEMPIFWYHPEGSEIYRVIYGDLRVEDVAPEDLPE
jgi:outer membrane lipoprotein-sorting protein